MSKILPEFKQNLIQDILESVEANVSHYYAFASHPVEYSNGIPTSVDSDYDTSFINSWLMLFGKQLSNTDIVPVIKNNAWSTNTSYERYDNTSNTLFTNTKYYAITPPEVPGGYYHIYKCIDNANNANSTVNPSSISTPTQSTSFQTSDSYVWRYISSISTTNYDRFATADYVPLYSNSSIVSAAGNNAGVEVIVIANNGVGYDRHSNGTVQAVINTSTIQVQSNTIGDSFHYDDNGIYLLNNTVSTSQLLKVDTFTSNATGKFVRFTTSANTDNITPGVTLYSIAPDIVIETDGDIGPTAYCNINASSNSIHSIIVLTKGSFVSWANVSIDSPSGTGANLYTIINPPGGHGSSAENELNVQGLGINFKFSNNESNTIITSNTLYNKIGIAKGVYYMNSDFTKGNVYTTSTFDQVLKANVTPAHTFVKGEKIKGANSKAVGYVVFSNSTQVYVAGDKDFQQGESVTNAAGSNTTTIQTINETGDIYYKDLVPFYTQSINNVNRSNNQNEAYKLIIKL
jgi:hypothetical protein